MQDTCSGTDSGMSMQFVPLDCAMFGGGGMLLDAPRSSRMFQPVSPRPCTRAQPQRDSELSVEPGVQAFLSYRSERKGGDRSFLGVSSGSFMLSRWFRSIFSSGTRHCWEWCGTGYYRNGVERENGQDWTAEGVERCPDWLPTPHYSPPTIYSKHPPPGCWLPAYCQLARWKRYGDGG